MEGSPDLEIQDLWKRHPGLTKSISGTYHEAATICLYRHHKSPTACNVDCGSELSKYAVRWRKPSDRIRAAWANDIDATEAGAYAMCLAAVEKRLELVALRRAETLTGADYYVSSADNSEDGFENFWRLEISGMNSGTEGELKTRLHRKKTQAQRGESDLPALAAVVSFKPGLVLIAEVEAQ